MNTKLEEEAVEFTSKRKTAPSIDRTALRYYAGCALSGLIPVIGNQPNEEVLNEAFRWANLMIQKEQERV